MLHSNPGHTEISVLVKGLLVHLDVNIELKSFKGRLMKF